MDLDDCKATQQATNIRALFTNGRHYECKQFTAEEQQQITHEVLEELLAEFPYDKSLTQQEIQDLKDHMRRQEKYTTTHCDFGDDNMIPQNCSCGQTPCAGLSQLDPPETAQFKPESHDSAQLQ